MNAPSWRALLLATGGLTGLGVGLLTMAAGNWLVLLGQRVGQLRRSATSRQLARYHADESGLPEHVLYGYPALPWDALGYGLALSVFVLLMASVGWPYALGAGALLRAPHLVRKFLRREGQARLRLRVRDFVDDLREAYAIHGSLGQALAALVGAVDLGERRDAVAQVLAHRARTRTADMSADQVLRQMSADLKSAAMQEVADQTHFALASGMPLGEALDAVATTLSDIIAAEVNVRLQAAPNTYVLPMVLFMFGPLLILMLYPLALRIVTMLSIT